MLTHYERFIFEDGKIRVRHDQAGFTRDATPGEVWAELQRLESALEAVAWDAVEAADMALL